MTTDKSANDYNIIVDIDGVLLDIHSQLSKMLAAKGLHYDVNEQHTYDIERFLKETKFNNYDISLKEEIYKLFKNPDLYTQSESDWNSIALIKAYARKGIRFMIYTLSMNSVTMAAKCNLFKQWFPENDSNIIFRSTLADSKETKKAIVNPKAVVEDSHINLSHYSNDTFKYLVNKPYNQSEPHEQDYKELFNDPRFTRCADTYQAIKIAAETILNEK